MHAVSVKLSEKDLDKLQNLVVIFYLRGCIKEPTFAEAVRYMIKYMYAIEKGLGEDRSYIELEKEIGEE
jgi:hypothetical protein